MNITVGSTVKHMNESTLFVVESMTAGYVTKVSWMHGTSPMTSEGAWPINHFTLVKQMSKHEHICMKVRVMNERWKKRQEQLQMEF